MQSGDKVQLEITALARGGAGLGRTAEGQVVFVPFTAPGDLVEASIYEVDKRYALAKLEKLLRPSEARVTARCTVFGRCGGCEWQHLPYDLQWQTKSQGVLQALARVQVAFAGVLEELPAEQIWSYRNRVQLRGSKNEIGFFGRGSQDLVPIERCEIADERINAALGAFREEGRERERPYKLELSVMDDGTLLHAWNAPHAATGFRQIHETQNKNLQEWVHRQIESGGILWDLFGGNGNLSLNLAARMEKVCCVDIGAQPKGASLPPNFLLLQWEVDKWLKRQKLDASSKQVILDPPREGLGPARAQILDALVAQNVTRIVAVGCDVDAWAQDLSRMVKRGYQVTKLAALDLFPQTHHVEALAVLERI